MLKLAHLDMTSIPMNVIQMSMSSLIELDLSHNQLDTLTSQFSVLDNLKILNLSFNQFRRIPVILKSLKSLNEIHLDHNPLSVAYERVLAGSVKMDQIKPYLFSLDDENVSWNECKVMIVGSEVCSLFCLLIFI